VVFDVVGVGVVRTGAVLLRISLLLMGLLPRAPL